MGILGYGIDVVDVDRFERVWNRFGDRLLDRVFSDAEREWCLRRPSPASHLAVRFSAKEAFIKAYGSRSGIHWKDVEVAREPSGKPTLTFHGKARQGVEEKGVKEAFVSLAHDAGVGVAGVILEG